MRHDDIGDVHVPDLDMPSDSHNRGMMQDYAFDRAAKAEKATTGIPSSWKDDL